MERARLQAGYLGALNFFSAKEVLSEAAFSISNAADFEFAGADKYVPDAFLHHEFLPCVREETAAEFARQPRLYR